MKLSAEKQSLTERHCQACRVGGRPLRGEELRHLAGQIAGWDVVEEHHLCREFKFGDFAAALDFVNRVAAVAEKEGHHPWIHFTWGKVRIEIWTHKIDGLSEADFVLAAKIDRTLA